MKELKVVGIGKARTLIGADWPTHIISVVNDAGPSWGATSMEPQHGNHEVYNFHDVEDPEVEDLVPPSRKVMGEIVETLKAWDLTEANLLIHCTAGKSRSTAIAIAALVMDGKTPEEAITAVKLLSPAMCPNRLMIEYLDDAIGQNGKMLEAVEAWYAERIIMIPGLNFPNRGGYNR